MTTIKEKLLSQNKRKFIDRETETSLIKHQLYSDDMEFNVVFFYGVGGVGKSSLLDEIQTICNNEKVKNSRIDLSAAQNQVVTLRQLRLQVNYGGAHTAFSKFDTTVEHYIELTQKLGRQGAFDGFVEIAAGVGNAIDPTGLVGRLAGDKIASGLKSIRAYLTKPEVDFYLNTSKYLTQAFHDGYQRLIKSKHVIILDAYEHTSEEFNKWILNDFIPGLSSNTLIVLAGRNKPGEIWTKWIANRNMRAIELLNFNEKHTNQYLISLGIEEKTLVKEIFTMTDGHPLSISLSVELGIQPSSKFFMTKTLVNKLLSDVDIEMQKFLGTCATFRFYNRDSLAALDIPSLEKLFDKSQEYSFVRQHPYGFSLHEIVQNTLQLELSRSSYTLYYEQHQKALKYIQNELQSERAKLDKEYFYQLILEMIYQSIMLSEDDGILKFTVTFLKMDLLGDLSFMQKMLQEIDSIGLKKELNKKWLQFCNGRMAFSEQRLGDAIEIFRNLADQYPTRENIELIVYSANRLSQVLAETNNIDLAILYAKRSLDLCKQIDNDTEKARALNALVNALQHQGNLKEAINYLIDAEISTIQDHLQRGEAYISGCICYRDMGMFSESIEYGKKGLQAWQFVDFETGISIAFYNIASTHLLQRELDLAKNYLNQAMVIFDKFNNDLWIARCLARLGEINIYQNNNQEAISQLNKSFEIRQNLGDNYGMLIVKELKARALIGTGLLNDAENLLRDVEYLAQSNNNFNYQLKALIGFANLDLSRGNFSEVNDKITKIEILAQQTGITHIPELEKIKTILSQKGISIK